MVGLPQALLPDMEYPVALVMCSYPNASPEEVENIVTKPLEQALASVENLDQMYSIAMQGQAIVMIQFQMNTDMNFATLNMREKVAMIAGYLPSDVSDPMVMKLDMNAMPVIQIYVSGDMSLSDLNDKVSDNVVSYFERVEGVASVSVTGAVEEEISMEINQEKLSGYGLSLGTIAQILAAENINMPSGDVNKGSSKVIVRTIGQFESVDDIKNIPITLADRSIIRLHDLATITEKSLDQESISRIDGKTALGLSITKQSDANTVEVSDKIQKTISSLQAQFPELTFTIGSDQADFIRKSISSVSEAAIIGALLAVLVVFLFLKNIRSTLIIALSIPTSLLATFALMQWQGMSLNMITLCALTIVVGMLVDDAIIVLENIFRIRKNTDSAEEASVKGSKEVYLAIAASTFTKMLVFIPIALSDGIASLLFKDFCFTIIIALLASLVVSLTVVPMLCSKLLNSGLSTEYIRMGNKRYKFKYLHKFTVLIDFLTKKYGDFMRIALTKRKHVIISCILVFAVSVSLVAIVGTELMPATDEGSFSVTIEMPYGTSLENRDKYVSSIETYISDIPEVERYTASIGSSGSIMSIGSGGDTLSVTLVPQSDRDRKTAEVVKEVKEQLSTLSGADITVEESSSMGTMMGGADMSLMLKGKELKVLETLGNDIIAEISKIEGVADATLDVTEGNPEVRVVLNRNTASYYGVTAYQLANGLSSALSGSTATTLKVDGNETDVVLSLPSTYKESVDNMKQIMITGATGLQVPVGQIANFEFDNSPNMINRINQVRYVTLDVDIQSNDLSGVSAQVVKLVDSFAFPDGYYYDTGGQQEQMLDAFGSLALALVIAIALVYLLLAAQFESLTLPAIVMMAIPFAMSGAFFALFVTGTSLSMTSFLGLIMLVGIVISNSILLVEFIRQNKLIMGRDEALIQAGKVRLRPILMTTVATCAGMIPMSLSIGEGTEMLAPMAISIIGGLIASTLVTLVLIPVLYGIVDDHKNKRIRKAELKDERIRSLETKWEKEDLQYEL